MLKRDLFPQVLVLLYIVVMSKLLQLKYRHYTRTLKYTINTCYGT